MRQFRTAGLSLSPSSISHHLNNWRNLVPALLKVFGQIVGSVKQKTRSSFLTSVANYVVGKLAVFDTSWLTFSSRLVFWALPGDRFAEFLGLFFGCFFIWMIFGRELGLRFGFFLLLPLFSSSPFFGVKAFFPLTRPHSHLSLRHLRHPFSLGRRLGGSRRRIRGEDYSQAY